jgi:hypothetical protein
MYAMKNNIFQLLLAVFARSTKRLLINYRSRGAKAFYHDAAPVPTLMFKQIELKSNTLSHSISPIGYRVGYTLP